MKDRKKTINRHLCFIFIFTLFLSSCQRIETDLYSKATEDTESVISQHSQMDKESYNGVTVLTEKTEETTDYTFYEAAYKEISPKSHYVVFKYPQLFSGTEDYSAVNKLIEDTVSDYLSNGFDKDFTDMTLEVNYEIAFSDNELLSIVFEGWYNVYTAAHPGAIFLSINIDLTSMSIICLSDLYNIETDFYDIYVSEIQKQSDPVFYDYFTSSPIVEYKEEFLRIDSPEGYFYSYYTADKLGIAASVPYALGDYHVIEIDYQAIAEFKKE